MRIDRRGLICGGIVALTGGRAFGQGLSQRPPAKPVPGGRALVARARLPGRVAFAVFDPTENRMLDQGAAEAPFTPASVLKIVTALYVLEKLGPDYRFRTRILQSGDTLILAGAGDPVLSSDDLAAMASDLVATGQVAPSRFQVWGGALPYAEEIAPAQADYLAYNPSLSGMILNFNRVHLGWQRVSGEYRLSLQARAARYSPQAYTITAQATDQREVFGYRANEGRENWTVSRRAMGKSGSRWLPVRKSELYAGDVFQTLCRSKGLELPPPEVTELLSDGVEIAAHESPPLSVIVRDMLKYSTNLTAEAVGLHASGAPDLIASGAAMRAWLAEKQPADGCLFADHSGLSADSCVTADAMVRLLAGARRDVKLAGFLKNGPPIDKLVKNADGRAQVLAKTGTLNFVSNLAGYVTGPSGRQLAFAMLCADDARHKKTRGQERPAGVAGWTGSAKELQRTLIASWITRFE